MNTSDKNRPMTIAGWYCPDQGGGNQILSETIRTLAERGQENDVVGLEWRNVHEAYDFLANLEDLLVDVMEAPDKVVAIVHSRAFQTVEGQRQEEFRQLMDTMKEALDFVADHDSERAARLTAKVYVRLKTAPVRYQRLFDGLLHKYTGVFHTRAKASSRPQSGED